MIVNGYVDRGFSGVFVADSASVTSNQTSSLYDGPPIVVIVIVIILTKVVRNEVLHVFRYPMTVGAGGRGRERKPDSDLKTLIKKLFFFFKITTCIIIKM